MPENKQLLALISSDGQRLELPLKAAKLSKLVQNSLPDNDEEDDDEDDHDHNEAKNHELELLRVGGECLKKVVEFLNHHNTEPMIEIPVPLGGSTFTEVRKRDMTDV
jgi:hypothetical protein